MIQLISAFICGMTTMLFFHLYWRQQTKAKQEWDRIVSEIAHYSEGFLDGLKTAKELETIAKKN